MNDLSAYIAAGFFSRVNGPLGMRLIVQPIVAAFLATRDGIRDARVGATPFGYAMLIGSRQRHALAREAWRSIGKVFVIAFVVDAVDQYLQASHVYLGEALIIGQIVAIVPYILLRGPITRLVRLLRR